MRVPSVKVVAIFFTLFHGLYAADRIISADFPDQTDAAIDSKGRVHVAYGVPKSQQAFYRMYAANSADATAPVSINNKAEITIGHERGPKIAIGKHSAIFVIWQSTDGLLCARSSQSGSEAQFVTIKVLDKDTSIDVPNIANDDAGNVYAVWVDHRHHTDDPLGAELYMAQTDKEGLFGVNTKISDDRWPVCPCCMPEIQCSGNTICVLYRSTNNGVKEMILRRADRANMKWITTVISKDNWQFQGCPMSGAHLAIGRKTIAATWKSQNQYNLAVSRDGGKSFAVPQSFRSTRHLPMLTTHQVFGDQAVLTVDTLQPVNDDALTKGGRVVAVAWKGSSNDAPVLLVRPGG